jgi:hypothetical protein
MEGDGDVELPGAPLPDTEERRRVKVATKGRGVLAYRFGKMVTWATGGLPGEW